MIVQCDKCSAKYRIPDEKIKGKGVRVKCTKCQNLFTVTAPPTASAGAPAPSAPVAESRPQAPPEPGPPPLEPPAAAAPTPPARPGLDFEQAFRDGQSKTIGPLGRPDETASAPGQEPPSLPDSGSMDWGNISLGAAPEPPPTVGSDLGLSARGEPVGGSAPIPPPPEPPPFASKEEEPFAPPPPPRAQKPAADEAPSRGGGRGLLILFLVLIILGGGGYLAYKDPRVKALLGMGSADVGGALVVESESLKNSVLTNRQGIVLAVIRGLVKNSTSSSQGMIRVEAQFKDANDRILKRVAAYCGNIFTDQELQTSPLAKVQSAMQDELGQALSNSSIPVGQSVPFMVVLENPPKELEKVTVTVLSSESR